MFQTFLDCWQDNSVIVCLLRGLDWSIWKHYDVRSAREAHTCCFCRDFDLMFHCEYLLQILHWLQSYDVKCHDHYIKMINDVIILCFMLTVRFAGAKQQPRPTQLCVPLPTPWNWSIRWWIELKYSHCPPLEVNSRNFHKAIISDRSLLIPSFWIIVDVKLTLVHLEINWKVEKS